MPLSERQLDAAHRLGQDVCVVAGPGSGKTSVLIERFSWLVRHQNIAAHRILAITFTEKAATEIRQRLMNEFRNEGRLREEIERAWVSTIHSFCARLLRENAIEASVDPAFSVLEQARSAKRDVGDQVLEAMFAEDPPRMRRFLRSLAVATDRDGYVPDLASSLVEIYDAVRLAGASFEDLRCHPPGRTERFRRLRELASEIAADRPRTRTPNQAETHGAVLDWIGSVLSLPHERVTEDHIDVVCSGKWNKGGLVQGSAARAGEDERRALCKDLLSDFLLEYYAAEHAMVAEALQRIDAAYRERKRGGSLLDFDDLEQAAIQLLEHDPALRERIRTSFDFILMDELQDTNPLQWRLMELVRRPGRFFAVGDVNQSIYGFRHARPELFGNYRRALEDAGHTIDELRDNYRSRSEVLDAVNRIFTGAAGVEPHRLIASRDFASKSAESVDVIVAFGERNAEAERIEASWVARRILEMAGNIQLSSGPARYGDMAILTRANYSTAELQRALDDFGIPSVVVGGLTFYDTREVRDLKLFIDVLVNPRNEVALAGLLRSPFIGVSDEELFRMTVRHGSLHDAIAAEPPPAWQTVKELRELRNQVSPDLLLRRALDECDYESRLTDRGRSNVGKFLAMLREKYARAPLPLAEMAADIEQSSPEAEAPPPDFGDAVRLMTMHKAKGLEFPIVFLPFLHKGRSYEFPIISYSHAFGLGVKWRNPVTSEGAGDTNWQRNRKAAQDAQEAEENRLLYVGCTRAKEHLVLSCSRTGNERGTWPRLLEGTLQLDLESPANSAVQGSGFQLFTTDRKPPLAVAAAAGNFTVAATRIAGTRTVDCADSSASATDVSRFSECPRKYYLSRYLGQKRLPSRRLLTADDEDLLTEAEDISAGELGVQVHALLAGQPVSNPAPEALQLAERFRSTELFRRAERASRKEHEWDFVLHIAGLVVRGQIDLWFEHNRELVIVDYKTDRDPDAHSVAGHSLQLRLYALALEKMLSRRVDRAVLYFLRSNREHEVDVSPLALGSAVDMLHFFRSGMSELKFPLNQGEHCRRCEFLGRQCPARL